MRLLTFLGTGNYRETIYTWQGQEKLAYFAPLASCEFLRPDTLSIFLTEEAEQKVFPAFRAALPSTVEVNVVPIPLGQNVNELWVIFDRVSQAVKPKEQVAFDITHGLRSFPLVGLLVAAFLRSGLNVDLHAVLYGAWDVRDQSVTPNRTPLFDLSPMIALMDWAAAADRFNRTGDARFLASLLKDQKKAMAEATSGDPTALREVGHLSNLAGALTSISQSLRLIRPEQAMQQIAGLEERVQRALPALEQTATARPFALLLESVIDTYRPLAHANPQAPENLAAGLDVERQMIRWYHDRQQWVQAVSLAREWLLSWVMLHLGMSNLTTLSARQRIENVVGSEAAEYMAAKQAGKNYIPIFLANIANIEAVLGLWLDLTQVRNDIDHAGKREKPQSPESLIDNLTQCIQRLEALPL